ncbi:MAG: prolipoprotein diacylglyceryl transferase [Oligosphaeraceae bacterium]|nr:prolipoprotein diacylglyceryl transferase [Oligosphaeraceae bacterium]
MISPVALQIGSLSIRWYGVCTAIGLLAGYFLQLRRAKRYSFNADMVSDLTFICMLAGVIGARMAYVLRFWSEEFANRGFWSVFKVWEGGLVFQGGFIAAALAGIALVKLRKWNLADAGDLMAPALPLGHAIGRIGCLINGCCFGFIYHGPLAIHYPNSGNAVLYVQKSLGQLPLEATECAPVFPIQALESLCNLAICLVVLLLEKKNLLRGRLFLLYVLLYSIIRFALEFARGDYTERLAGLSNAQITCLWIIPLCLLAWLIIHFVERKKLNSAHDT